MLDLNRKWSSIKLDIGDILFFLYLLVIARQYMWVITDNIVAWFCTVILTIPMWIFYYKYKLALSIPKKVSFYFILFIIIPFTIIYILRLAFPDYSYDIMNNRILMAQRSLTGPLFGSNDVNYQFLTNPTSDMILGIFRFVLGYRLGTIVNLIVIIWLALELYDFLKYYFNNSFMISIIVFIIIFIENIFYEINTYMIDLLALPILIHILNIVINKESGYKKIVYISFLTGMVIALKLTNIILIIPMIVVLLWKDFVELRKLGFLNLVYSLLFFALPLIPFTTYMYVNTANPIFPLYNNIFHSPYWTSISFRDLEFSKWGPNGLMEIVFWPLFANIYPDRISELPYYSGRLGIGIIAFMISLIAYRKQKKLLMLNFVFILSAILWSMSTGYIRYGILLDIIAGINIAVVMMNLTYHKQKVLYKIIILVLVLLVQFQLFYAFSCMLNYEWSLRPTLFTNKSDYLKNIKYVFNDFSLKNFLTQQELLDINNVDAWLDTDPLSNGIEIQLKDNIPYAFIRGYFDNPLAREKLDDFINKYNNNMYSLCKQEDISDVEKILMNFNLSISTIKYLDVPYYSYQRIYKLALIKIVPNNIDNKLIYEYEFPGNGYQADISPITNIPQRVPKSTEINVLFKVTNISNIVWPMAGKYPIRLGSHWCDSNGNILINDDGRTNLKKDLSPSDSVILNLKVKTPAQSGKYILQIDMVQESIAWFNIKGSKVFSTNIDIY